MQYTLYEKRLLKPIYRVIDASSIIRILSESESEIVAELIIDCPRKIPFPVMDSLPKYDDDSPEYVALLHAD